MKKRQKFKFEEVSLDNISDLTLLINNSYYELYKNGNFYLHDIANDKLFTITTTKNENDTNFFLDLTTAYDFIYHIKWSAALTSKQKLTIEDAKFIFDQSEKYLKDSIDTTNNIVLRVNTIITIVVAIIAGLSSYVISEWRKTCAFDDILISSTIGVLYFYLIGFFAVRNIYPSLYFPIGSLPKDLFNDAFFAPVIPDEARIIRYYVSEIENYQYRIEKNNFANGKKWRLYKKLLWALLSAPIMFILIYCLLIILHL